VIYRGPVSGSATVGSDGSYMFGGTDGTYVLVAKAPGYIDSASVEVTLPPSRTSVNFLLDRATMAISPAFISGAAAEGGSSTETLTLSNQGNAVLTWKIASQSTNFNAVTSFDVPDNLCLDVYPRGMAYDGRFLWFTDSDYWNPENLDKLHKIDPTSGEEVGFIRVPGEFISSLCWDAERLWAVSNNRILAIDPVSGAILKVIPFSGYAPYSLSVGDGALWVLTDTKTIKKVSADDGTELDSFPLPSQILSPRGMVFFNGNLWVMSPLEGYGMAYKVSPSNGSLLDAIPIPGSQLGYSSCHIIVAAAHDSLQHLWLLIHSKGAYPKSATKVLVMDTGELTWLSAAPSSGAIPPGGSQSVTVTMDARLLKAGTYGGNLVLESNDTAAPSRIIPVTFTVKADSDGDGIPDTDDPDDDNDWMSDEDEGTAGTNPLDADSEFKIQSSEFSGNLFQILFNSVTGRLYGVEYKNDLMDSSWSVLTNNLPGDGDVLSVVDLEVAERRFYRISVRLSP